MNYWMYEWYDLERAFDALSKALFECDGNLIKVAECYAKKMEDDARHWCHPHRFEALVYAIEMTMGEDAHRLIEVGMRALDERPHYEYHPGNGYNKNRFRHAAYQRRIDEAQVYHESHRTSKCWKDQSRKRRQWQ